MIESQFSCEFGNKGYFRLNFEYPISKIVSV